MPDFTPLPKPPKGEYRRKRKADKKAKLKEFQRAVFAADGCVCQVCKMLGRRQVDYRPSDRNMYEAMHLNGNGRSGIHEPWNGMVGCWYCHDLLDGRHNNRWKKLSADQRKIKVLIWFRKRHPLTFDGRGWRKALDRLESRQRSE